MKKLLPLCLALMLALALAIPAAASGAALPAGGVSVQVNGENITFPNGSPEVINGRTMVPMREVLEALGAEVDYDADTRTVTAALGGVSLTHVIGTNTIKMTGGEKLTMDTTSYVKNGSTLVPLRFFSQALGYEVYWDGGQSTAVVIDKAAFVSKTDESFTILNGLQSGTDKDAGFDSAAMDVEVSGEVKLLDGTSEDAQPFSGKMTALVSNDAVNFSGSMDLSAVAAALKLEDNPMTAALAPMLNELTFEVIGSDEGLWMKIPALNSLLTGTSAGGGMWLKSNDFDMSAAFAAAAPSSDGTIGSALYEVVEYVDADGPVNIYRDLIQASDIMTALLGDGTFTKDGDDYTWELDDDAAALMTSLIGEAPDELSMKMEIKADGGGSFSMRLRMEDTIEMALSGEFSDTSATVKCQLTIPEVCDVTVQSTAAVKESDTAPVTAPPAGETVVDIGGLIAAPSVAGVIGGADRFTAAVAANAA